MAWMDPRDSTYARTAGIGPLPGYAIFAQRILFDSLGPTIQWQTNGIELGSAWRTEDGVAVLADSGGGAFIAWTQGTLGERVIRLQHISATGTPVPGWPDSGIALDTGVGQQSPGLVSDGGGGVLATWADPHGEGAKIQRITSSGQIHPGWAPEGRLLALGLSNQARATPADLNGTFVTWDLDPYAIPPVESIHVLRINLDGSVAPGWNPAGHEIAAGRNPTVTPTPWGATIVYTKLGIRAAAVAADGPVPTLASLVEASVTPAGASLVWYSAMSPAGQARLYRREADRVTQLLALLASDGAGWIRYLDPAVQPGRTYFYHLGLHHDGAEHHTPEVAIAVPLAPALEIAGIHPNPTTGAFAIDARSGGTTPIRLQVFDVSGRLVWTSDMEPTPTATNTFNLDLQSAPPGVYLVRVSQAGLHSLRRVLISR